MDIFSLSRTQLGNHRRPIPFTAKLWWMMSGTPFSSTEGRAAMANPGGKGTWIRLAHHTQGILKVEKREMVRRDGRVPKTPWPTGWTLLHWTLHYLRFLVPGDNKIILSSAMFQFDPITKGDEHLYHMIGKPSNISKHFLVNFFTLWSALFS